MNSIHRSAWPILRVNLIVKLVVAPPQMYLPDYPTFFCFIPFPCLCPSVSWPTDGVQRVEREASAGGGGRRTRGGAWDARAATRRGASPWPHNTVRYEHAGHQCWTGRQTGSDARCFWSLLISTLLLLTLSLTLFSDMHYFLLINNVNFSKYVIWISSIWMK